MIKIPLVTLAKKNLKKNNSKFQEKQKKLNALMFGMNEGIKSHTTAQRA